MKKTTGVIATCAVLAALTGCGGSATGSSDDGGKGGSLTFVSFGGAFQDNQTKAWSDPFTAKTGIKVTNDAPPDPAKLRAMVEAKRVSWDVMEWDSGSATSWCGTLLEKLDYSVIDRDQFPEGTATDCGVPGVSYGLVMLYNADDFKDNPPTKLADFYDTKSFPGKRVTSREVETGLLENALLADGVPADKLYPLDVDHALDVWGRVKGQTTFAKTYGQIQQLMVSKQASMALVVQARALSATREGAPFKPVWDKTTVVSDDLMVPKGAPNKAEAMKYIAFATQAPQSAKFAELSGTAPANVNAKPTYDAKAAELDPLAGKDRGETIQIDSKWWAENGDDTRRKFTLWLGG